MKRFFALSLAALMVFGLLAGCSSSDSQETPKTPEELTQLYKTAIEGARDQETNEAISVITSSQDDLADLVLPMVGITDENATSYAVAVSPMNTRAYGIVAVRPAADKSEEVLSGLQSFIDTQKQSFEQYLPDQSEIANSARLETLEDGTILLVMCEGQDDIFTSIQETIEAA